MGSLQIYNSSKQSATEKARYYTASPAKRIGIGLAFLALLAVTSFGMLAMQIPLADFQRHGITTDEVPESNDSIIHIK